MIKWIADLFRISEQMAQIILPIIIIHIILIMMVIFDVVKNWQKRVYPLFWILLAIVVTIIGPLIYLVVGRKIDGTKK